MFNFIHNMHSNSCCKRIYYYLSLSVFRGCDRSRPQHSPEINTYDEDDRLSKDSHVFNHIHIIDNYILTWLEKYYNKASLIFDYTYYYRRLMILGFSAVSYFVTLLITVHVISLSNSYNSTNHKPYTVGSWQV